MRHSTISCEGQHYWEPHDNPYRWNLISLWKCMTHKQGNELYISLPRCGLLQWCSHFANIMEIFLWLKLSTMVLFSIASWWEHLKYTLLIMEDIVFKVLKVSSHKERIINIVENPIVSKVVVGSSRLHLIFEEKGTHKDFKEKFSGGINPWEKETK